MKEYNYNQIFDNFKLRSERKAGNFRLFVGNYIRSAAQRMIKATLDKLLTFFGFPAEHARHLRTTNPIESVFATIRLPTKPMKRFRTISSGVHLVFKLLERTKTGWRGIGQPEKLKEVKLPN